MYCGVSDAPIAGSKRQAAAVDTLASVKVRKTAKDDGQDKVGALCEGYAILFSQTASLV